MKEKQFWVFPVGENDKNKRIDKIIRTILPNANLSLIYSSLRKRKISVNNKKTKPDYKIQENDKIWVHESLYSEIVLKDKIPESLSGKTLTVIFEDDDLIIVNKAAGILCHGENSLANDVIKYLEKNKTYSLSFSPGPINRLDRNTSGLNLFSKSLKGAQIYSKAFQRKDTEKYYLGITDGTLKERIKITSSISRDKSKKISISATEGKEAETIIYPLLNKNNYCFCLFHIKTGRTHQIRLHSAEAGHSLCGDSKYKGSKILKNYFLHSYALKIKNSTIADIIRAELTNSQLSLPEKLFSKKEIKSAIIKADEIINKTQ